MTFACEFASSQTKGRRDYQEDYCAFVAAPGEPGAEAGAAPPGRAARLLATLADGMGGHVGGAVASLTAVEAFKARYSAAAGLAAGERLLQSLQAGNEDVARRRSEDEALDGMGCTLIGAYFENAALHWVSVGDSLILLYRNGKLVRLNADHSMAPELDRMAERREITPEQARADPMRHALRSAVTGAPLSLVDLRAAPYELRPGDWVILASDGLETLSPAAIQDALDAARARGAQAVADALVDSVNAAGRPRQDNATVMAVHVLGPAGKPEAREPDWHPSMAAIKHAAVAGLGIVILIVGFVWLSGGESQSVRGLQDQDSPGSGQDEIQASRGQDERDPDRGTQTPMPGATPE